MDNYKDHQYIKKYESSILTEKKDANGKVITASKTEIKHYQLNLANKQGMKAMKAKKLFEVHDKLIKSNVDAKLFTYMVTNQSSTSKIVNGASNPATVKYLSTKFDVTERKVQKFISEAIDLDMLKRVNKDLYLNPYLVSPFNCTNNNLHQLQLWWENDPKEEIVFIEKEDIMKEMITNAKKIIGAPDEK